MRFSPRMSGAAGLGDVLILTLRGDSHKVTELPPLRGTLPLSAPSSRATGEQELQESKGRPESQSQPSALQQALPPTAENALSPQPELSPEIEPPIGARRDQSNDRVPHQAPENLEAAPLAETDHATPHAPQEPFEILISPSLKSRHANQLPPIQKKTPAGSAVPTDEAGEPDVPSLRQEAETPVTQEPQAGQEGAALVLPAADAAIPQAAASAPAEAAVQVMDSDTAPKGELATVEANQEVQQPSNVPVAFAVGDGQSLSAASTMPADAPTERRYDTNCEQFSQQATRSDAAFDGSSQQSTKFDAAPAGSIVITQTKEELQTIQLPTGVPTQNASDMVVPVIIETPASNAATAVAVPPASLNAAPSVTAEPMAGSQDEGSVTTTKPMAAVSTMPADHDDDAKRGLLDMMLPDLQSSSITLAHPQVPSDMVQEPTRMDLRQKSLPQLHLPIGTGYQQLGPSDAVRQEGTTQGYDWLAQQAMAASQKMGPQTGKLEKQVSEQLLSQEQQTDNLGKAKATYQPVIAADHEAGDLNSEWLLRDVIKSYSEQVVEDATPHGAGAAACLAEAQQSQDRFERVADSEAFKAELPSRSRPMSAGSLGSNWLFQLGIEPREEPTSTTSNVQAVEAPRPAVAQEPKQTGVLVTAKATQQVENRKQLLAVAQAGAERQASACANLVPSTLGSDWQLQEATQLSSEEAAELAYQLQPAPLPSSLFDQLSGTSSLPHEKPEAIADVGQQSAVRVVPRDRLLDTAESHPAVQPKRDVQSIPSLHEDVSSSSDLSTRHFVSNWQLRGGKISTQDVIHETNKVTTCELGDSVSQLFPSNVLKSEWQLKRPTISSPDVSLNQARASTGQLGEVDPNLRMSVPFQSAEGRVWQYPTLSLPDLSFEQARILAGWLERSVPHLHSSVASLLAHSLTSQGATISSPDVNFEQARMSADQAGKSALDLRPSNLNLLADSKASERPTLSCPDVSFEQGRIAAGWSDEVFPHPHAPSLSVLTGSRASQGPTLSCPDVSFDQARKSAGQAGESDLDLHVSVPSLLPDKRKYQAPTLSTPDVSFQQVRDSVPDLGTSISSLRADRSSQGATLSTPDISFEQARMLGCKSVESLANLRRSQPLTSTASRRLELDDPQRVGRDFISTPREESSHVRRSQSSLWAGIAPPISEVRHEAATEPASRRPSEVTVQRRKDVESLRQAPDAVQSPAGLPSVKTGIRTGKSLVSLGRASQNAVSGYSLTSVGYYADNEEDSATQLGSQEFGSEAEVSPVCGARVQSPPAASKRTASTLRREPRSRENMQPDAVSRLEEARRLLNEMRDQTDDPYEMSAQAYGSWAMLRDEEEESFPAIQPQLVQASAAEPKADVNVAPVTDACNSSKTSLPPPDAGKPSVLLAAQESKPSTGVELLVASQPAVTPAQPSSSAPPFQGDPLSCPPNQSSSRLGQHRVTGPSLTTSPSSELQMSPEQQRDAAEKAKNAQQEHVMDQAASAPASMPRAESWAFFKQLAKAAESGLEMQSQDLRQLPGKRGGWDGVRPDLMRPKSVGSLQTSELFDAVTTASEPRLVQAGLETGSQNLGQLTFGAGDDVRLALIRSMSANGLGTGDLMRHTSAGSLRTGELFDAVTTASEPRLAQAFVGTGSQDLGQPTQELAAGDEVRSNVIRSMSASGLRTGELFHAITTTSEQKTAGTWRSQQLMPGPRADMLGDVAGKKSCRRPAVHARTLLQHELRPANGQQEERSEESAPERGSRASLRHEPLQTLSQRELRPYQQPEQPEEPGPAEQEARKPDDRVTYIDGLGSSYALGTAPSLNSSKVQADVAGEEATSPSEALESVSNVSTALTDRARSQKFASTTQLNSASAVVPVSASLPQHDAALRTTSYLEPASVAEPPSVSGCEMQSLEITHSENGNRLPDVDPASVVGVAPTATSLLHIASGPKAEQGEAHAINVERERTECRVHKSADLQRPAARDASRIVPAGTQPATGSLPNLVPASIALPSSRIKSMLEIARAVEGFTAPQAPAGMGEINRTAKGLPTRSTTTLSERGLIARSENPKDPSYVNPASMPLPASAACSTVSISQQEATELSQSLLNVSHVDRVPVVLPIVQLSSTSEIAKATERDRADGTVTPVDTGSKSEPPVTSGQDQSCMPGEPRGEQFEQLPALPKTGLGSSWQVLYTTKSLTDLRSQEVKKSTEELRPRATTLASSTVPPWQHTTTSQSKPLGFLPPLLPTYSARGALRPTSLMEIIRMEAV